MYVNVSDIKPGDPVQAVFLVSTAEVRETRRGDPYLRMSLRDRSGGSIDALFFGASEADISLVTAGKPFEIDGEADEFRNRVNIKVNAMRPSSETWDASAHLPRSMPWVTETRWSNTKHSPSQRLVSAGVFCR